MTELTAKILKELKVKQEEEAKKEAETAATKPPPKGKAAPKGKAGKGNDRSDLKSAASKASTDDELIN